MQSVLRTVGRRAGGFGVLLTAAMVCAPLAAHADVLATFDWVSGGPTPENPTSAATTLTSGTLTLDLSGFSLTGTTTTNFGPYYASGADASNANVVGLNYTFADGVTANLSDITSIGNVVTSADWATSGAVSPYQGTPTGYYLINAFNLYGTVDGANFDIGNDSGDAGATYANGVGDADNSFNGTSGYANVTDGGYWELASVSPVPLNPTLVLLFSGLGMMAWVLRRNGLNRAG